MNVCDVLFKADATNVVIKICIKECLIFKKFFFFVFALKHTFHFTKKEKHVYSI